MLPAPSYAPHFLSHSYRPQAKDRFHSFVTNVQTALLYRPCTQVFLRQSMQYNHLLQTFSEGGNQEQMTTTAPHATSFVAGPAQVDTCLDCRDWGQLLLLVYLGYGLDYTAPQHIF